MNKWNIPCHGCRHYAGLLPEDCSHGFVVSIPEDWMAEPKDCLFWQEIAAGISVTESLGRKLFE